MNSGSATKITQIQFGDHEPIKCPPFYLSDEEVKLVESMDKDELSIFLAIKMGFNPYGYSREL